MVNFCVCFYFFHCICLYFFLISISAQCVQISSWFTFIRTYTNILCTGLFLVTLRSVPFATTGLKSTDPIDVKFANK